jgi:predicted secreted protein
MASAADKPTGTLIDFQAQAQQSAPNDLGHATAYFESTGSHPGELATKVNQVIATALGSARAAKGVTVRTGNTHTTPIYAKGSRQIESWRMRSELRLESRDAAALSELLGKLQATLAVGNIGFSPSPETRRKVEDAVALDAIAAFQEKAARYANALKRPYVIRSMNIGTHSAVPPAPTFRAAALSAEMAPMPIESGESQIVVSINGQIELTDHATPQATPQAAPAR